MRRFKRLQARCQKMIAPARRILRKKSTSRPENPHGFELPRTLSCRVQRERQAEAGWGFEAKVSGFGT
jgi:hypothetical protein